MNEIINRHPSILHGDMIDAICLPLQKLGINYFSHVNVSKQNEFSGISSSAQFSELYFRNKYYLFDSHQDNMPDGEYYLLWDQMPLTGETRQLEDDFNACGFGHTFSIITHHAAGKDCYHFSAPFGDVGINGKYLFMLEGLKRFIRHFKEEIYKNKTLAKSYDLKIPLGISQSVFTNESFLNELDLFKSSMKNKCHFAGNHQLTAREMECLYWLSHGKTFEETSIILQISQRTVKAHIGSAKNKTGCHNLFQLGMTFRDCY
jgi:DNA-binding CsgD family transcriptional regulator